MIKVKKLTAVLAVLALMGTVVGCGGAGKGGGADTAKTIKIGINMELSGQVAEYGAKGLNGAMLAIEEVNKKGGILGKQLEPIKMDNKSDASESANVAAKLAQQGIVGYIGAMTTGATQGFIPIATQNKIPLVSPTATNPTVTVDPNTGKVREYVFRVCFQDPFQGEIMAKYAYEDLKARKAAVYKEATNDYSSGLAKAFEENFKALGGTIVASEGYQKNDKDFKSSLTKIQATNPDVIFVPGYYNEVGLIVKQGREKGITVPFLGGDGWGSPQLITMAGMDALNNTYYCNHFSASSNDPKVVEFVKAYKAKYNSEPDGFAALGYDAAYLLMDAIQRAGSTDTAKITQALAATKDFKGVCGVITMDENHNPVKPAVIIGFENGKEIVKTVKNP